MARLPKLREQVRPHLDSDETIFAAVCGQYETSRLGSKGLKTGAMFVTDRRVVFFAKRLTGYDFENFPYENISSFELGKKFLGHYLSFFCSGNEVKLKWINEGDAKKFADVVRQSTGKPNAASQSTLPTEPDIPDQIRKLGQLLADGILSEEEFAAKKSELLSRM
ncbi:MAG: PH domain-containing protein [Planctomycetota bacterium]